jgi:Brp/Blh family beta-carotene 15,15'-monooxygenase
MLRPDEMTQILSAIIPGDESYASAGSITNVTTKASLLFIPLAAAFLVRAFRNAGSSSERLTFAVVPLVTVVLSATTPILVSFTLYFCLWHSVLGLRRLRRSEGLALRSFLVAVAPLSFLAVVLVVVVGTVGLATYGAVLSVTTLQSSTALQMTFIGLASIAIPHIFLHEFGPVLLAGHGRTRFTPAEDALAMDANV